MHQHLINFLIVELEIPPSEVRLALRPIPETPNQLPMMLWHYGLINLEQLERIFDWLEDEIQPQFETLRAPSTELDPLVTS